MEIKELETADYDIVENFKVACYRWWKMRVIVLLSTLVGLLCFLVFVTVVGVHTFYKSTATIYSASYGSFEDSAAGVTVMNTYAGILNSTRVCNRAAASLGEVNITSDQLKNMMNRGDIFLYGASSNSRQFGYRLTLSVTSSNSENVVQITNAVAQAFADEMNDLLGNSSVQVLDTAKGFGAFQSINQPLMAVLFGAVGFAISTVIIFLKEFFSSKVYSVAQCESNNDLVLGLIPYSEER